MTASRRTDTLRLPRAAAVLAQLADLALYLCAPQFEANPLIADRVWLAVAVKAAIILGVLWMTSPRVVGRRTSWGLALLLWALFAGALGIGANAAVLLAGGVL